ncbi:MAG TPA: ArsR family transcriptional regulator [Bacillus bacterium]|uniref:Transcriptional regulator n=1 Tax=Siminovitchia fordii TaxID=254759 RepID=A0ABQ4K689_9BACI|nr:metalloregulator ArsR/SmtB family transcription factor [Siminovitchia fordii]GIN21239.1 transcriptional regulator [Siminovitchia fordii]HBZ10703.1 ArsR family transcriptional regulator [Bacillus sp. (in: firmicutes)]
MDTTTLSAFAESNRLKIIDLLRDGPLTVGEIANRLQIRQPQASKHLRVLSDAGIVTAEVKGNRRIYHLRSEPFIQLDNWLASYRKIWDEKFNNLDDYLMKMQKENENKE